MFVIVVSVDPATVEVVALDLDAGALESVEAVALEVDAIDVCV